MQLTAIQSEIAGIVPHEIQCATRRKEHPGECSCKQPETVEKLNSLVISLLKGRK